MEAKKQAGRSPAAFFAEWPLSDPAMRPTRSVTASAQALDHSLPGKPERSLPPLGLLSPREPLRRVRAGALNAGRTPRREVGRVPTPARGPAARSGKRCGRPERTGGHKGRPYGEGGG